MMMIVKDSASPWWFNDGENKLKAPSLLASGSLETADKSLLSAAKKKLLDISSPWILQGFVLPVGAENLHNDPDGLFNEMVL